MVREKLKGFTLIELVMVIVILGILAAVALPRYINLKSQAQVAALKGALGAIRAAISIYYASTAVYGDPTYPSVAELSLGGLFANGVMPYEPINNKNTVTTAVTNTGGWAYWPAAGTVCCNVTGYTSY